MHTTYHIIQAGETLSAIASRYGYGDWHHLHAANPHISNPNRIYPGQVLYVPDSSSYACHPNQPTQRQLQSLSHEFMRLTPWELALAANYGDFLVQHLDPEPHFIHTPYGQVPIVTQGPLHSLGQSAGPAIARDLKTLDEMDDESLLEMIGFTQAGTATAIKRGVHRWTQQLDTFYKTAATKAQNASKLNASLPLRSRLLEHQINAARQRVAFQSVSERLLARGANLDSKFIPSMKRGMIRMQHTPKYSINAERVPRMISKVSKGMKVVGGVAIGIQTVGAGITVVEAINQNDYRGATQASSEFGFSMLGAAAGIAGCSAISLGTLTLACTLVAPTLFGTIGTRFGRWIGAIYYDGVVN